MITPTIGTIITLGEGVKAHLYRRACQIDC